MSLSSLFVNGCFWVTKYYFDFYVFLCTFFFLVFYLPIYLYTLFFSKNKTVFSVFTCYFSHHTEILWKCSRRRFWSDISVERILKFSLFRFLWKFRKRTFRNYHNTYKGLNNKIFMVTYPVINWWELKIFETFFLSNQKAPGLSRNFLE